MLGYLRMLAGIATEIGLRGTIWNRIQNPVQFL